MASLSQSISFYRLQHSRYPEAIDNLVEAGIILKQTPDPWGTSYELHIGIGQFAIHCAGPDQQHGTFDDQYEFGVWSNYP